MTGTSGGKQTVVWPSVGLRKSTLLGLVALEAAYRARRAVCHDQGTNEGTPWDPPPSLNLGAESKWYIPIPQTLELGGGNEARMPR